MTVDDDSDGPFSNFEEWIDEATEWHRLPKVPGLVKLIRVRNQLREKNLYDTEGACEKLPEPGSESQKEVDFRTFDGNYNDLQCPHMGAVDTAFGRNFPLEEIERETDTLMEPSPRTVSRELLRRDSFKPVEILNMLAAAWIQFQVHDWFAHENGSVEDGYEIPLKEGDTWPHGPMRVEPTVPAYASEDGWDAFANRNTHWWDASQVYGGTEEIARRLRSGTDGKMKTGDEAILPLDVDGVALTGFQDNWWIGLSMLHSLFVEEHNAICERLKLDYSHWGDERLFQQARLINAALLAKIHTVEWTPAILPHETVSTGLHINWEGIVDQGLQQLVPLFDRQEVLGGIPGSPTDHHGTPYSLTEEFVAVYRMHPLMPDDFDIRSAETGESLGEHTLGEVSFENTRTIMARYSLRDLYYSFGVSHPGALKLHNYPSELRAMTKPDGRPIDLAAIDVLRDRERGVPRYNDFRELLRMDRVSTFEELTGDPETAAQVREVYDGEIDDVDLMVGLFAEPLLEGFGFSETAFRIFILMASRRLKSDRFFTEDFTEERYTRAGIEWIRNNDMQSVIQRHLPELRPTLDGVDNAFQPWPEAGAEA